MYRWDDVLEVAALEQLERIDCSTARCASNARGTGRLVRSTDLGDDWYLEVYCPDCASPMHVRSASIESLAHALLAAAVDTRDEIAARWIRARADSRRPWTVP